MLSLNSHTRGMVRSNSSSDRLVKCDYKTPAFRNANLYYFQLNLTWAGTAYWPLKFPGTCGGRHQSPIDVDQVTFTNLGRFRFQDYDLEPSTVNVTNNGHTSETYNIPVKDCSWFDSDTFLTSTNSSAEQQKYLPFLISDVQYTVLGDEDRRAKLIVQNV